MKRRNRQRRLHRERVIRADEPSERRGPHEMDVAQPQLSIDELPQRYRELAKHAAAVLHYDGVGEDRADTLAVGSVLALLRVAGLTVRVGMEPASD